MLLVAAPPGGDAAPRAEPALAQLWRQLEDEEARLRRELQNQKDHEAELNEQAIAEELAAACREIARLIEEKDVPASEASLANQLGAIPLIGPLQYPFYRIAIIAAGLLTAVGLWLLVLSRWLWDKLKPSLPALSRIIVHETCNAACEYDGN